MDNTTNGAEEAHHLSESWRLRLPKRQKDFFDKLKQSSGNPSQWVRLAIDEKLEREKGKWPFLKDESETDKAA